MSKRNTLSEAHIQATCTAYLELDSWRALRTDPTSDRSRGKGFGELGMADHLYIRYEGHRFESLVQEFKTDRDAYDLAVIQQRSRAQVLFVEYKSASGTVKPAQLQWAAAERARGALVWLATVDFPPTIEGFQQHYRESGLARNVR